MMTLFKPYNDWSQFNNCAYGVFPNKILASRTRAYFSQQQKTLSRLNGHIEETIGIFVVRPLTMRKKVIKEFKEQNNVLRDVELRPKIGQVLSCP